MAAYNGQRPPNIAHYLRCLNVQEAALDDVITSDDDLKKDLAVFTNTQFYDFDSGQNTDYQAHSAKPRSRAIVPAPEHHPGARAPSGQISSPDAYMTDFSHLDFLSSDFNFGEFGSAYTSPTTTSFPGHLGGLPPVQIDTQQAYNSAAVPPPQPGYLGPSVPSLAPGAQEQAEPSPTNTDSFEELSRRLSEEDKRRRNTAASARFRIKKKQREQALERSAKEMLDKVNQLEAHISSLETENKWLRRIVMDKHGKEELPLLFKELRARAMAEKEKRSMAEKEKRSKSKNMSRSSTASAEGRQVGQHGNGGI